MSAPAAAPAVWFPAIRTGTGSDVFTIRLCEGLNARGIRSEITWLPHRAEYLPWTVAAPVPPAWATLAHLNTWVHRRFIPAGLPLVATMHLCVHDPALRPYKSWAQRLYHRFWVRPMERHLLRQVRQLVAVSRYTAERTHESLGVSMPLVIPNGVPISPDWADPARFLRRPGGRPFRLLYVGNWSRRKGVDLLAPLMQALGPGFELDYTADAHGAHQGASLPARCRCIGRLGPAALQDAYRRADALIFPSRLEGLPLTVIEAMAQGLPVVAAAASSLPELVRHGETGLLFAQDDVAGAADCIRSLARNPSQQADLARRARHHVLENAGLDVMIEAYVAMYQRILAGEGARSV